MANIKKYVSNRRCFGGLVFFLAAAVAPIASLAQTRDVTLTPDQLPGLTITLPDAGEFQVPVTATGPGGSVTRIMRVLVVPPPTVTVRDVEGPAGKPIPLDITATDGTSVTLTIPGTATLSTETTQLADVTVRPGDDIQAAIDGSAEGAVIRLLPGTFIGQAFVPKDRQVILADGAVMDGQGSAVRAIPHGAATGVRIVGLTVTNYNSPAQADGGAIDGRGHTNWTLLDVNVVANSGQGIHLGAGWQLIGGLYADNGTIGIGGGDGGTVTLDGLECRNNNTTHQDLGFESGCMKIWNSTAEIRNICSWGNWGPGIWLDGQESMVVAGHIIEDNLIFDNKKGGIEIELQSGGVVRNNTVIRNGFGDTQNGIDNTWGGGAGITIQNSGSFSVHDNYVEVGVNAFGDVGNSIFTVNQNRVVMARDNDIFNNRIVFLVDGKGTQGTVQDFDSGFDPFAVNTWRNNVIVRRGEAPVRYGGWYSWTNGWRTWNHVQGRAGEVNSQLILEQRQPTQVRCPSP